MQAAQPGRWQFPDRRDNETFVFELGGLSFTATVRRFGEGQIGEVFLNNHKAGHQAHTNARKPNGHDHAAAEPKEIVTAIFRYRNEADDLAFVVGRTEFQNVDRRKKKLRQKRPDPPQAGQWIRNVDGVPILPYRLPELLEAVSLGPVSYTVEGEAKANLLRSWNVPATCCAGGARKSRPEHSESLRGERPPENSDDKQRTAIIRATPWVWHDPSSIRPQKL